MADTLRFFLKLFEVEIVALLLTLPRIYAFLATSQLLNPGAVPRMARSVAILVLAIPAIPLNYAAAQIFARTPEAMAFHFIKEIAIGFLLGYLFGWVFWVVQAAGALIDNQRGAAIASSIDPLQGHESSPLGLLFSQAFLTYLFATGAVLQIFGILYTSYALWPSTSVFPVIPPNFPEMMLRLFDNAFRVAVVMGAPIIAAMFMAEFALALVSRFAPQLQVFVIAMPIKSGLAIFMLIFYFTYLMPFAALQTEAAKGYVTYLYQMLGQPSELPNSSNQQRGPER
jgi:type III secretion protein T